MARLLWHKRLASYVAKYDLELKARPSDQGVVPNAVAPVREPSIAEQRLHELIHLPCQSWCKFCVQHKARNDAHEAVDSTECALSVVSFDFGFTGRDESSPDDKLVFLAVHDSPHGMERVVSVPRHGGSHTRHYLASELTRVMSFLKHKESASAL